MESHLIRCDIKKSPSRIALTPARPRNMQPMWQVEVLHDIPAGKPDRPRPKLIRRVSLYDLAGALTLLREHWAGKNYDLLESFRRLAAESLALPEGAIDALEAEYEAAKWDPQRPRWVDDVLQLRREVAARDRRREAKDTASINPIARPARQPGRDRRR
jgi:hypothetical protein